MTMPIILPRVSPDAASGTPNATGMAPAGDGSGAAVPVFGAVLTLMLAHVAGTPAVRSPGAETTDTPSETDAGESTVVSDEHSAIVGSAPIEAAADAAIDEATAGLGEAMPSMTVAIAIPTIAGMPPLSAGPTDARRSLELVAPQFRERLDRVIERMESEFGYKVEVTETYRSQARQDMLYARGRSEPGQVVTWTRSSNHTAGRAADLVIDGSYDNPLAFERLARIAREEGLRTLGPRDPGHVELPSSGATERTRDSRAGESKGSGDPAAAIGVIARPAPSIASHSSIVPGAAKLEFTAAAPAAPNALPGVARVAAVATVAPVAQLAQVAQVVVAGAPAPAVVHGSPRSRVVEPGAARSRTTASHDAAPGDAHTATGPVPAGPAVPSPATATNLAGESSDERTASHEPNGEQRQRARIGASARDAAADVLRQTRDELLRAVATADPTATSPATSPANSGAEAPATTGHTDMSERIARLLKVQDAAADRPLSQVVLRLERPDGGEDRLRVDLRGSTVSATLHVADTAAADTLGANVKELQRALERHGFETDSLTVRTASRTLESSTLTRAAGAAAESDLQRAAASSPNTSSNTSSRERGARHDEDRPSPDSQRHRSRREQKGDR